MEKEKAKDAGLALVLILLLTGWLFGGIRHPLVLAAAAAVLICMISPRLFTPFAFFWYGLARVLGTVVSTLVLTVIFLALVLPVGLARRLVGADPMLLKRWKKDDGSVFMERYHTYDREDLEDPY